MRPYSIEAHAARYTAGEGSAVVKALDVKLDGTARAIICLHGHGGDFRQFLPSSNWALGLHIQKLVDEGYILLMVDQGGGAAWSNQNSMDMITNGYNWLTAGRAKGNKVGIMGWSMGGLTALNWVKRNQAKTSRAVCWAAATDLVYHHQGSGVAEIDAAFPGGWVAMSLAFDPTRDYLSYRPAAYNVPTRLYQSADDPTVPPDKLDTFLGLAANPALEKVTLPAGGHFPFGQVDVNETVPLFNNANWS